MKELAVIRETSVTKVGPAPTVIGGPESQSFGDVEINKPDPNELVEVSISATTIMTQENYEKFIRIFAKNFHNMTHMLNSEKFHSRGKRLMTTPCGKYGVGMIFTVKDHDGYWMVIDVSDKMVYGRFISSYLYEKIRENITNVIETSIFPLELHSYIITICDNIRNWKYNETGLIDHNEENIDYKFELVETLPMSFLCYLLPIFREV